MSWYDPEKSGATAYKELGYLEKVVNTATTMNSVPIVLDHVGLKASLQQTAEDINNLFHFTVEVEDTEHQLSET